MGRRAETETGTEGKQIVAGGQKEISHRSTLMNTDRKQNETALLRTPSAIAPEAFNVPLHREARRVRVVEDRE